MFRYVCSDVWTTERSAGAIANQLERRRIECMVAYGGRVQLAIRCAIGVKDAVKMLAKMVYNFKDASAGVNGRVNQFVKSGANRKIKCSLSLYKCTSFREVE